MGWGEEMEGNGQQRWLTLDKRYLVEHNSTVVLIVQCTPPRDCPFAALALAPQSLRQAALGVGVGGREGGRAWCVALPCVLLRTDAGPLSGQLIPFRTTRSGGGGGNGANRYQDTNSNTVFRTAT